MPRTYLKSEIKPGVAIYLTPFDLITFPTTLTNAADGTAVNRIGYFLVVERFDDERWLCAPLYTEKDNQTDREPLNEKLKRGHHSWRDPKSFYSPLQFWAISDDDLITSADRVDASFQESRNSYAKEDNEKHELDEVASHKTDSSTGFRHIDTLPPQR